MACRVYVGAQELQRIKEAWSGSRPMYYFIYMEPEPLCPLLSDMLLTKREASATLSSSFTSLIFINGYLLKGSEYQWPLSLGCSPRGCLDYKFMLLPFSEATDG